MKTKKTAKRRKQEEAMAIVIGDLWHEVQKLSGKLGPTCRLCLEVCADGAVIVNARWYAPKLGHTIDSEWARYGMLWEEPKNMTVTEMARTVTAEINKPA